MTCIGYDEGIMGIPEETRGISTKIVHKFKYDTKDLGESNNFSVSEPPKLKKEAKIIDKSIKNDKKRGNAPSLF